MADFRRSSDENTDTINKVIVGLGSTLRTEQEVLSHVRSEIKHDNTKLNTSVVSKIEQLQKDLAVENNLTDKLAQKTENAKILSFKLQYMNKHLDGLESEKTVIKSCVSEINHYIWCLVESRDSLLTVSVRQHLADQLKPVFLMLNRIEGVLKRAAIPK